MLYKGQAGKSQVLRPPIKPTQPLPEVGDGSLKQEPGAPPAPLGSLIRSRAALPLRQADAELLH
jgi:hypothetical protein